MVYKPYIYTTTINYYIAPVVTMILHHDIYTVTMAS